MDTLECYVVGALQKEKLLNFVLDAEDSDVYKWRRDPRVFYTFKSIVSMAPLTQVFIFLCCVSVVVSQCTSKGKRRAWYGILSPNGEHEGENLSYQ